VATTIPDGQRIARERAAREQITYLRPDGDEARYMLAFVRWRLGTRASRPGPAHYLGDGWAPARCAALEAEVDAYLAIARNMR